MNSIVLSLIFFGVFGAIWGSFLNVCIDRLLHHSKNTSKRAMPEGCRSLMIPTRSFCFACGKTLAWYDNIPIVSYVILSGRCRHCLVPYGVRSLWTELCCLCFFAIFGTFLTQNF